MLRVDAHHHLWEYNAAEFDWLDGDLAVLRRNFLTADLIRETRKAAVSGTVAVQARQTISETDWLLRLAAENALILGTVGWLPLRDDKFGALLDRYHEYTALRGLRHVIQGEPAGFMDDRHFNRGIDALRGSGLVYDILIFEAQLEEATRFVDRHPNQSFVLDHLAKPRIATGELEPWSENIRNLARRENVVCKLSGMVTEADPGNWIKDDLKPYFDVVVDCFTPARLMAGSDWPVLDAGCAYQRWWEVISGWTAELSHDEQADILGRTAIKTYGLTPFPETRDEALEILA